MKVYDTYSETITMPTSVQNFVFSFITSMKVLWNV